jgi:glycosyltransferase involved in cell wall biosynthesis
VCHNGVDVERYAPYTGWPHDPFRLGWIGTLGFRGHDLSEVAVGPLREALDGLFGKVELWHMGADLSKGSIHDLLGPKFPVQVREFPWVTMEKVPEMLPELDAAIIPQVNHPFNQARSAVTGLQMAAAGVPFVASATDPYKELWRLGAGYAIDNSPGTWAQSIRMLVSEETRAAATDIRTAGFIIAAAHKPERVAAQWEKVFATA